MIKYRKSTEIHQDRQISIKRERVYYKRIHKNTQTNNIVNKKENRKKG